MTKYYSIHDMIAFAQWCKDEIKNAPFIDESILNDWENEYLKSAYKDTVKAVLNRIEDTKRQINS